MQLRQATSTEAIWYSKGDERPQHPNHPRTWYSRNLHCYECRLPCSVCGQTCCLYSQTLYNVVHGTEGVRIKSTALAKEIEMWARFRKDESTFLECSTCHEWACPDCIGICPDQICQDRQCVRCKADPFAKCDWH